MRGQISKALDVLRDGPTTLTRLAERLGSDVEDARAVLGILVSLGYVKELVQGCTECSFTSCGDCPFREGRSSNVKMYMLTGKGSDPSDGLSGPGT